LEPAQVEGGLTAKPDSISELFARDPLTWNEADMQRMVAAYRKMRVELKTEEVKTKGRSAAAAKIPKEELQGTNGADLLSKLGLA
jgi:hypothetical protein